MTISQIDPNQFWNKVDKSAGPTACWFWLGRKRDGVGSFAGMQAYRIAYHLTYGAFEGNLSNTCRAPDCINPQHWIVAPERRDIVKTEDGYLYECPYCGQPGITGSEMGKSIEHSRCMHRLVIPQQELAPAPEIEAPEEEPATPQKPDQLVRLENVNHGSETPPAVEHATTPSPAARLRLTHELLGVVTTYLERDPEGMPVVVGAVEQLGQMLK